MPTYWEKKKSSNKENTCHVLCFYFLLSQTCNKTLISCLLKSQAYCTGYECVCVCACFCLERCMCCVLLLGQVLLSMQCVFTTQREGLLSNSMPQWMCKWSFCCLCSPDEKWLIFIRQPHHGRAACNAFIVYIAFVYYKASSEKYSALLPLPDTSSHFICDTTPQSLKASK